MNVGEPPVNEGFEQSMVDGINVYIMKHAVTGLAGLKITLGGWWIWRGLRVHALRH